MFSFNFCRTWMNTDILQKFFHFVSNYRSFHLIWILDLLQAQKKITTNCLQNIGTGLDTTTSQFGQYKIFTTWKLSVFGVVLIRIFPHSYSISPNSVRMRGNADQNNSAYGHILRSDCADIIPVIHVSSKALYANLIKSTYVFIDS